MKYQLNNRPVDIIDYEWAYGEGAWCTEAVYQDTGINLTEDELEAFNSDTDNQSQLYEDAYVNAASDAYDLYKDRMKYGD